MGFEGLTYWLDKDGAIFIPIFPMLVALVLVLLGQLRFSLRFLFLSTTSALFVVLLCSALLSWRVYTGHSVTHALGGWAMPRGIGYKLDELSAPFLLLVSYLGFVISISLGDYAQKYIPVKKHAFFLALFLLAVSGFLGIILTHDAFNVFVFLEIASLSSCALISFGLEKSPFYSAFNYLIVGSIGAGFYVLGVAFLCMGTGVLSLPDIHHTLTMLKSIDSVTRIAFCFIMIGLSIKAFGFFVHRLLPQVYVSAPTPIASFFSGVTSKVMFYLVLRFLFQVFDSKGELEHAIITQGLWFLGVTGMIIPAVFACFENDMKRLLAYSSISNTGSLFLGVSLLDPLALCASIFQLLGHAFAKSSLLLTAGFVERDKQTGLLSRLRGALKTYPTLSFFLCMNCASLAGLPITLGFLGKWHFLESVVSRPGFFVFFVTSSLLSFFYSVRLAAVLVFSAPPEREARKPQGAEVKIEPEAHLSIMYLYIPLFLLLAASLICVFFGNSLYSAFYSMSGDLLRS